MTHMRVSRLTTAREKSQHATRLESGCSFSISGYQVAPVVHFVHEETEDEEAIMRAYFDDLYHLFLYRLTQVIDRPVTNEDEKRDLQSLLHELLRMKNKIEQLGRKETKD